MDSLSRTALCLIAVALLTLAVVAISSHISSRNVAAKQMDLQERQFRARILQQQKEAVAAAGAALDARIDKQVTDRKNRELEEKREEKREREALFQGIPEMVRRTQELMGVATTDATSGAPSAREPAAPPGIPPITATEVAIESRIDGTFNGWTGDTIFKLQNGQIWQQSMYGYNYHYAYIPKVVIYKTTGGWNMKVEGVDQAVIVKRIK